MKTDQSYTFEEVDMIPCEEGVNFKGADNRGNLDDLPAMCVNIEQA